MKKWLLRFIIAAAVILPLAYMAYRRIQNIYVARDARAELEAWYGTLVEIPKEENGAIIINRASKEFEDYPRDFRNDDLSLDNGTHLKMAREYVEKKAAALKKIEDGLRYEKFQCATALQLDKIFSSRVLSNSSDCADANIPSLFLLKNTIYTIQLKGRLLERDGRNDEAIEEYLKALRLALTLKDETQMISKMIEVGTTWMALEVFHKKLSAPGLSEAQLRTILDELKKLYYEPVNAGDMYQTEYYCLLKVIKELCEGTYEKKIKWDNILEFFNRWHSDFRTDLELAKKWISYYRNINPAKYHEMPAIVKNGNLEEKIFHGTNYRYTLCWLMLPSSGTAWKFLLEKDLFWRGTIAMAAIRLFEAEKGRLPESLDELGDLVPEKLLIDPCSGNKFIYRKQGNDFSLYSVGGNGVDDGCNAGEDPECSWRLDMPDAIFHKPGK